MSSSEVPLTETRRASSDVAMALVPLLQRLADGEQATPEQAQQLLTFAIQLSLGCADEKSARAPLVEDSKLTTTDVITIVSRLLEHVNVEIFELAMWRIWGDH